MTTTNTSKPKATYYYKLFRVKRADGRVTTVSMDPALAMRACQIMGGLKPVGKLVREAALSYEDGTYKNCSSFVAQQLEQAVAKAARERQATAQAAALPAASASVAVAHA